MLCLLSTRTHFSLNWLITAASFGPVQFFKRLSTVSESVRGALLVGMCIGYTGRSWLFTAVSLGILESLCNSCWGVGLVLLENDIWYVFVWKCLFMELPWWHIVPTSAYLWSDWTSTQHFARLAHLNLCVCLSGVDVCWWWWDIHWPLVAVSPSNLAKILPWMYATYLDVSTCVKFLNGL